MSKALVCSTASSDHLTPNRIETTTGDLERLQSALEASGTVALAALQANTYRLPQSLSTANAWNEALKASSVAGGAQAYLGVMPAGL
jgi:hypothetical protein